MALIEYMPTDWPITELVGIGVDVLTEEQVIAKVLGSVERGDGGFLCTVNLDILRQCRADPESRRLVESASLVVADGMPLVWASRVAGNALPERVAGSSLIFSLPAAAASAGASVYLLGGNPGTAEATARTLVARSPGLDIAGTYCPPMGFEHDSLEMLAIEHALMANKPDIVFVGLGFPKQERLIAALRPALPAAWFVNCGVSFSFVAGELVRAPKVFQMAGLEWAHRLVQEPGRLGRRYLVDGLPFFTVLMGSALGGRRRSGRPAGRSSTPMSVRHGLPSTETDDHSTCRGSGRS